MTILPPPTDTQHLDAQWCPVCSELPRETPVVIGSGQQRVAQYVCTNGHGYSVWWKTGDA